MRRDSSAMPIAGGPRGNSLGRLWRACDAVTAVEAAFVLPALLVFLLGIIEVSRALWIQSSLQYAVTAAARCAAISPANCSNVPTYAASQAYGLSIPVADFTYTANATCGNAGYATGSQVAASYTFNSVVGGLIPPLASVHLSATACHP
jgi:Flp pilus assembly protein TadG